MPGAVDHRGADRDERYHAALASPVRREVLDALRDAGEPMDVAAVARRLDVHVTTARFHLDQLVDAGLVARRSGTERRRGRPRLLYAPTGAARDEDARAQLIRVLASALAQEDGHTAGAARAGRRWAGSFPSPGPDDPAPRLAEVLDRLGFDPEPDAAGSVIRLRACPFRDAAREHPDVVCAVHRGLVEQLLAQTPRRARLLPFVEPDLCLVALDRTPEPASA